MTQRWQRSVVLLVAAAFLGYWALLLYCEVWRPTPLGLQVNFDTEPLVVSGIVPGQTAELSGIRAGDRILAVDGHPIAGRVDWVTVEMNLAIGRPVTWDVDRGDVRSTIRLTPTLASLATWRAQSGPALLLIRLMQLVSLLLAIVVAMRRPDDASALTGAAYLAHIGVVSFTMPFRLASVWRDLPWALGLPLWIPFVSSVAIGTWGFSFFANFPRVRFGKPWAWALIWAPALPGLAGHAVFGYYSVVLGRPSPPLPPWTQGTVLVGAAYAMAALGALVLNYRQLTDLNERRRIRVLMFGSLIGGVSGTLVVLSYWGRSANELGQSFLVSPAASFGTFLFLVMPLAFAYAILQHRLFDAGLLIRQGLRYALARRAVLALVPILLVSIGADLLAHGDEAVSDVFRRRALLYVVLIASTITVRVKRQQWLDGLDRRFFRDHYNAQRLLRQVAEDVRHASRLVEVAPAVVARIEQTLHALFVELVVCDSGAAVCRTLAASPPSRAAGPLDAGNKLLALTGLVGEPLELSGDQAEWLASKLPAADLEAARSAGIELVVPIRTTDAAAGAYFVLGPKRSEEPYSIDDKELLMAVAESVAARLPVAPDLAADTDAFELCDACGTCYPSGTGHCASDLSALLRVGVPRVLGGRYRIERRIGQGGAGTVFEAHDLSLDRRVAAKLVRRDLAGAPSHDSRFEREARTAAAFSHPNVVTVHDFGVVGDHAFLIMELLAAGTLRDALREHGRLTALRTVRILRDVVAGVDAAHRRRLVHRDLKPENICLIPDDSGERAKVLDFGIARVVHSATGGVSSARTGGMAGTPLYMAPEQLRGEDPDPSWDIWALGIVAFEMLTGAHPFASGTVAQGGGLLGPGDPRLADLPDGCGAFFTRALALDRSRRPSSADAWITDFEGSVHG